MKITIDYLKNKGFNCDSIRQQFKGDFKLNLNRYGEYHYSLEEDTRITELEVKTTKELENLYYSQTGVEL